MVLPAEEEYAKACTGQVNLAVSASTVYAVMSVSGETNHKKEMIIFSHFHY